MPAPPYSSSAVMPSTPRSPNFRHSSFGNSLVRSISAARGAISSAAKLRTVSRSMSADSPRSKFRVGYWFDSMMLALPPEVCSSFSPYGDVWSRTVAYGNRRGKAF